MHTRSKEQRVFRALTAWRDAIAKEHGVPAYLVLPNTTIHAIAQALPRTPEELLGVKGIKEAKLREFGAAILDIVNGESTGDEARKSPRMDATTVDPRAVPVSWYLNALNQALAMTGETSVYGEVGKVEERGNAVYFTLKDEEDGSTLSVFMWKSAYALSGVALKEGMLIIATGTAEIYKPIGRLSFRAEAVELVGEGALKAAYEKLKRELAQEGLFAPERKRPLPELPTRIGLVTSKTGAVIHDFLNNLGKYGISVSFVDSRVEGVMAVKDILDALATLRTRNINALVVIRGGGSLESLQAFNNEHVVRAIATYPVPVICAIGHHEDVPLAQLAADVAPSTPTACATVINERWETMISEMRWRGQNVLLSYQRALADAREYLHESNQRAYDTLRALLEKVSQAEGVLHDLFRHLEAAILRTQTDIENVHRSLGRSLKNMIYAAKKDIAILSEVIRRSDPRKLLASGYAFAVKDGKILRSVLGVREGDAFQVHVSDGRIDSIVTHTHPNST